MYKDPATPSCRRELGPAQSADYILESFELRREDKEDDKAAVRPKDRRRAGGVCTKELAMIGQSFSPRMIVVSCAAPRRDARARVTEQSRAGHARSVQELAGVPTSEASVAVCCRHG